MTNVICAPRSVNSSGSTAATMARPMTLTLPTATTDQGGHDVGVGRSRPKISTITPNNNAARTIAYVTA